MLETAPAPATRPAKKPAPPRDSVREAVETIVFVVVLVLLLKLFVTEAFVIPTGSMAETLYGYQKIVTCPKCGYEFPVNSHDEVEGRDGVRHALSGCVCPNCRFPVEFQPQPVAFNQRPQYDSPSNRTGDRVLVLKPIYNLQPPGRGDVVVFKFPQQPQDKQTAQNYIKRMQGYGGETIGIHRGDLYVTRELTYPADARDDQGNLLYPRPDDPLDLWKGDPSRGPDYRYPNSPDAVKLFDQSRAAGFPAGQNGFEIIRKPVDQLLAEMRIVWDNDRQPHELGADGTPRWARWHVAPGTPDGVWRGDNTAQPRAFTHTNGDEHWIRYRHLIYPWNRPEQAADAAPKLIENFLAYNEGMFDGGGPRDQSSTNLWVGDLILECEATVETGAEVTLELSKGLNRFHARFAGGKVMLSATGPGAREFGTRDCKVNGAGKYRLRFANVDCRLHVWVDDRLIDFGTDADYPPGMTVPPGAGEAEGYTQENDVAAPAGVGAKGGVTVRAIKLRRDVYYTQGQGGSYLYYVQPDHYLCLGDNSAQSSDSRTWGVVPDRLMLGKAVFVFWPMIPSPNRSGFIK